MLLPDESAFRIDRGFAPVEFTKTQQICAWTLGDRQVIQWEGPDRTGPYTFRLDFWRTHPYPTEEIEIRYRFGESANWESVSASVGVVVILGNIEIVSPGQELRVDLQIPAWIPSRHLPDSVDDREIGLQFLSLELMPESEDSA